MRRGVFLLLAKQYQSTHSRKSKPKLITNMKNNELPHSTNMPPQPQAPQYPLTMQPVIIDDDDDDDLISDFWDDDDDDDDDD